MKPKTILQFLASGLILLFFFYSFRNSIAENFLDNKLKGKIFLQVEANGEAWYVHPETCLRYYLGRPTDAFEIMRNLGLGISEADIKKIPIYNINLNGEDGDQDGLSDNIEAAIGTDPQKSDSDNDGYSDKEEIINNYNPLGEGKLNLDEKFSKNNIGKILIQVQKNGEAWYITSDGKRAYLGRPTEAFNIMRLLGIGITNNDLEKIPAYTSDTVAQDPIENRNYTSQKLSLSFSIPASWKIDASDEEKNSIILSDYNKNILNEKKGQIIIIKIDHEVDLENIYRISSVGNQVSSSSLFDIKINEDKTEMTESNYYEDFGTENTSTFLKTASGAWYKVILYKAGNEEYYDNIYKTLINEIRAQ